MSDLYEIIGADPDASFEELRRSYLATIGEVHPDRAIDAADAAERTRLTAAVTAAWSVLGDPVRRHGYDRSHGMRRLPIPLRRLRSLLSRRRWLPGRPHPRIDLTPVRGIAGSGWALLYETRLGQWSLVLLGTFAAGLLGGATGGAGAGTAIALLLAGAGDPTPLGDARRIASFVGGLPLRLVRGSLRSAGAWLSPRLAETIEREQRFKEGISGHLEQTKRSIAREGEPPPPPPPAPYPAARRRPRPPRSSWQPRSRRP